MNPETYSDFICDWLVDLGYTHCFFVAGGNIMHLLNSARTRFKCIPVTHEVSAVISTEYFNESSKKQKAFALVTAGPGITNCITGITGAWLESRELLVLGGQVKISDLKIKGLRQKGIQEIDGLMLTKTITKFNIRLKKPINKSDFKKIVEFGGIPRKGPIFIEIPLDIQGLKKTEFDSINLTKIKIKNVKKEIYKVSILKRLIKEAERPIFLIGAGINRENLNFNELNKLNIPIMTTWNAVDRIDSKNSLYFGRPNTWGQRYSNVLLQQSDLIIGFGTRFGLQQTGFNWKEFAPNSKIVHIDVDKKELQKKHPIKDLTIELDANFVIDKIFKSNLVTSNYKRLEWIKFCKKVKSLIPINEKNMCDIKNYINPYDFFEKISEMINSNSVIIPCSSGGAFTTFMQTFNQKKGQIIISNKGLASMGYGLAGAIGASFSNPNNRIYLFEGDGGFLQNVQELATVNVNKLPLKIFIFSNEGYASIKMTQINYFNGNFIGCDSSSGLQMPKWGKIAESFNINHTLLDPLNYFSKNDLSNMSDMKPHVFIVPIDPKQTYYPKISSRIEPDGVLTSNPLHLMTPKLSTEIQKEVFRYI